jgi:aspartate racemase
VFAFKAGDLGDGPRREMRRLAAALVEAGAEAVIGGCTEVPLLLEAGEVSVALVDSAEVLAEVCVRVCVGGDERE